MQFTNGAQSSLPQGAQLTALDETFRNDPYPTLAHLRSAAPVHFDGELVRWVITQAELVRELLKDKDMSSDPRKANPASYAGRLAANAAAAGEGSFGTSIVFMDDPDHRRLRALVSKDFSPKAVELMRPRIRAIANKLLDAVAPGEFDLIAHFAGPLPVIVIAEMLGVDPAERGIFKQWSDLTVSAFFNPLRGPAQNALAKQAQRDMNAYFMRMIEHCRREPGDDLISGMILAQEEGSRMTDAEILSQCNILLIAGNVTTTDLIGNGMKALLDHPSQLALLRSRPDLIANAVEEMLRYDAPVVQTGRNVQAPRTLGGCPMHLGDSLTLSLAGANHDPNVNAYPERFDIQRSEIRHQSFGGGKHLCLGAFLARVEAQEAILALLERFPKLSRPYRTLRYRAVPGLRGLEELWLSTE